MLNYCTKVVTHEIVTIVQSGNSFIEFTRIQLSQASLIRFGLWFCSPQIKVNNYVLNVLSIKWTRPLLWATSISVPLSEANYAATFNGAILVCRFLGCGFCCWFNRNSKSPRSNWDFQQIHKKAQRWQNRQLIKIIIPW
jgi:hypothetical protein